MCKDEEVARREILFEFYEVYKRYYSSKTVFNYDKTFDEWMEEMIEMIRSGVKLFTNNETNSFFKESFTTMKPEVFL